MKRGDKRWKNRENYNNKAIRRYRNARMTFNLCLLKSSINYYNRFDGFREQYELIKRKETEIHEHVIYSYVGQLLAVEGQ